MARQAISSWEETTTSGLPRAARREKEPPTGFGVGDDHAVAGNAADALDGEVEKEAEAAAVAVGLPAEAQRAVVAAGEDEAGEDAPEAVGSRREGRG